MAIFTALAIAAAIGGAGAAISNSQRRAASAQRNQANAAAAANEAAAKKTGGVGNAPASTPAPAARRGKPGKQSRTTYTSSLGLSTQQKSGVNLKVLTGT